MEVVGDSEDWQLSRKLAEKDESTLMASGIPYTIIRAGMLHNSPGGKQGFKFEEVLSII